MCDVSGVVVEIERYSISWPGDNSRQMHVVLYPRSTNGYATRQ